MKVSLLKILKYWTPLVIYSGIIFYLSSIPSSELPPVIFADKIAHLLEYFLWGVLAVSALKDSSNFSKIHIMLVAVTMGVVFSISDEIHQIFISGREFSYADLLFDFIGLFIGSRVYV